MIKNLSKLLYLLILILLISHFSAAQIHAQESWLKPVPTPPPATSSEETVAPPKDTRSWTKYEYNQQIKTTAEKYGIDPQLIYATIMTESMGNPHAYRFEPRLNEASYGLGQILASTARSLGFKGNPENMFIPEIGIDLIGQYHKKNLDHFGNLTTHQLAIAYNTGSPWKRSSQSHLNRFNKWFKEKS